LETINLIDHLKLYPIDMTNILNAKELKEQASIVELLKRLGYNPLPKHGREFRYYSMIRKDDTTPSFMVDDQLGVWYDHGLGIGGNIIDFGLAYWKGIGFADVVIKLQEVYPVTVSTERVANRPRKAVKLPSYVVEETKALGTHPAITNYLKERCVFPEAKGSVSEVYYYVQDDKGQRKQFFAAGWKNESGGWEVRNKYFKGCLGRKAITFIPGDQKAVAVFEGFLNYLSWKTEHPGCGESIIVLNTLSLINSGISKAKQFSSIDLYLDRDASGHKASKDFMFALPYASDRSVLFEGYNDYNDKIIDLQKNISRHKKR
jgi:hypothetical protein